MPKALAGGQAALLAPYFLGIMNKIVWNETLVRRRVYPDK
jgi:hypothetical protein